MLYGLINKYGDIIIHPTYYHIAYMHSGYYKASPYMGKIDYHIIDTTGKILYEGTNLDYIIYNDGFVTIAQNGMGKKMHIYKIKTLILIMHSNSPSKSGIYNSRVLKVLKQIKFI